ncbi:hypothetical protein UY3_11575 [Chelonia mydas]|uniref:Uncharacterized protein n=1 Tax=Chelonia mydas TaxID=8469 RepID=M7B0K6_CHEMY|nr:hypothetical protein UY3_11575 [Chelonia mydas]
MSGFVRGSMSAAACPTLPLNGFWRALANAGLRRNIITLVIIIIGTDGLSRNAVHRRSPSVTGHTREEQQNCNSKDYS